MTTKTKPIPATAAAKPAVGTNSNKLPFTQDRSGARQELRRGGVRAVGRIMADKKRLEAFLADLEVLADYGRARFEEQRVEMANKRAAAAKRQAAQDKIAKEAAKADLVQKRRALARAEADVKTAEARTK